MKADYLTFKRAAGVSLMGLALQGVMGLALLITGIVNRDHAVVSGGMFVLLGLPVWLVLAVVFDQHRRERIEALENDALSASGGLASSAFLSEGGANSAVTEDLRVQHRRLNWMHRMLVPTVSLIVAVFLAAIGVWRYMQGLEALKQEIAVPERNFGWPIAIGLGLAFVGFVFARYVAGMGKHAAWANLRAGAAASVGASVVGLLVAAVYAIDYWGPSEPYRFLHVVIPAGMVLLAVEYVLNFLLGVYRPRKPGEFPRFAMESRVLGFLAAPDKIAESIGGALNYQFGFDVTGSWFYQLLSRSVTVLVLVGVAVIWAMTCFAVVQPNQQGIRVRLGHRVNDAPLASGPLVKWPWPFERIETFDATTMRRVNLGVEPPKLQNKSILWTNDHGVTELYFPVQASEAERSGAAGATGSSAVETVAKDVALISGEVPILYTVTDLVKFESFADPDAREKIIKAIGQREAYKLFSTKGADDVLGAGRAELSETLRKRVQAELDRLDSGVHVVSAAIEGVHPPRETAESFEGIVQSTQRRESSVLAAETESNAQLIAVAGSVDKARQIVDAITRLESHRTRVGMSAQSGDDQKTKELELEVEALVTKAGGTAAATIQAARGDRWLTHMTARSRAEAQSGRLAAYQACPEAYVAQTYFSTLREVMSKARVYIVPGDRAVEVQANLEEAESMGSVFTKPKETNP